jgi:outer membrane cobalamin receptor
VTSAATETAGYQVLNGTLEWKVTPALKIYARVLNLLDQKYEEVAGYGTYRRSYFLGARAEF